MTNTIAKLERMMIKHLGGDWDMADNDKMLSEIIRRDVEHQAAIAAAVQAERERCAMIAEAREKRHKENALFPAYGLNGMACEAHDIAAAIRAVK